MTLHGPNPQDAYRDDMLRPPVHQGRCVMVVVDRDEARVFDLETTCGGMRQLTPCGIVAHGRRFHRPWPAGGATDPLIGRIRGADAIVIVGHGNDAANVVADLLDALREHHPALSRRVIAAVPLLSGHPTDERLLELARTVFRQGEVTS